ncbi:unnamed protein product [Mytilus coruscus]|uniref:Reverse transcriptase/retrotransposon-derived protein RNase H-like domain-containing protein n=1 Tax=Mytilus coruscus TaxID=42192 RepID=A0A6J8ASU7_MYTCO|nr:unnamed protein product [Mytilus coruscus]
MLGTNKNVFAINIAELGCTDLHPHRIDTGDAAPVRQRFYRQLSAMKAESSKHIKEMLDTNIIKASKSEWASPVCLIDAVKTFPLPQNITDVRAFLGLANYYRKFVKGFSKIASPLHRLLVKGAKFIWDNDCQNSFDEIKTLLISAPILAFPDFSKDFILYTDASQIAIGYKLGKKIIKAENKSLLMGDDHYEEPKKGLLQNSEYIQITKHFCASRSLRRRKEQADLQDGLCSYKGTANGNADALSRRPYGTEIVTIKTATVESSTQTEATFIELYQYASICEITTTPKEKVVNDQRTDENFKDVIKYILNKELPDKTRQARKTVIESQDYIIDDDALFHLYYPKGKGHREDRIVKR